MSCQPFFFFNHAITATGSKGALVQALRRVSPKSNAALLLCEFKGRPIHRPQNHRQSMAPRAVCLGARVELIGRTSPPVLWRTWGTALRARGACSDQAENTARLVSSWCVEEGNANRRTKGSGRSR